MINDILAINYLLFSALALLIVIHGVPHIYRLMKERRRNSRLLALLLLGVVLIAIGEGGIVGYFAGSRFWDRPEWMVMSDLPGLWRFLATAGLAIFYFALYGRTWAVLLRDAAIFAAFVTASYLLWSI